MTTTHIDAIRSLPTQLRAAVAGLDDRQLDTPYRDGGWTLRQVVHHLADSHMNAFIRMRLILTEEHPTLKPYDQDLWAAIGEAHTLPLEPSLAIIDGLHTRWASMLDDIGEDQWSRSAYHPENGEVSLSSMLPSYADHGRNHVAQITGLRERMGW